MKLHVLQCLVSSYLFIFIFYLSKSVECTLSYDIPVQYKKIVLYKQDFITVIKSPSYSKRVKNI